MLDSEERLYLCLASKGTKLNRLSSTNSRFLVLLATLIAVFIIQCPAAFPKSKALGLVSEGNCPTYHTVHDQLVNRLADSGQAMTVRHRGYYDSEIPENSLQGFRKTFEKCIPALETDVQSTKDGALVLFHDRNLARMTSASFRPEDPGLNYPLASLTLAELKQFRLVTTTKVETQQTIPTVLELLQTMVDTNGQTIIFLDIKDQKDVLPLLKVLKGFSEQHPDSNLDKRIVLKLHLEWYPHYDSWLETVNLSGISFIPMANPVVTPLAAKQINQGPKISGKYSTNTANAWAQWSEAPTSEVPLVEVLLKDSTDFKSTVLSPSPMGDFRKPRNLDEDNAVDGTMAQMTTIAASRHKLLGLFSPVPDYILWKTGPVAGYTVRNTRSSERLIDVQDAFSGADGTCCYALKDLLSNQPEAHEKADLRENIEWALGVKVQVFTADDTDSIETYLDQRKRLNRIIKPSITTAPDAMNSRLSKTIWGEKPKNYSLVRFRGWGGGSSPTWGGRVCIWSNHNKGGWVVNCDGYKNPAYTSEMKISIAPDNTNKMIIQNTKDNQCLGAGQFGQKGTQWISDCSDERAKWERTALNQFKDYRGDYLAFSWQNLYAQGFPYAWLYTDRSAQGDWSRWGFF